METVLSSDIIILNIKPLTNELETTCIDYPSHVDNMKEEQTENINLPYVGNKNPVYNKENNITFEHEIIIDFKKLDELIEHPSVQGLNISTVHPLFLEIKKIFKVILTNEQRVMDNWKYKNTFISNFKSHHDSEGNRILQFIHMNWIDSFVTSFIFNLYH